MTAAIGGVGTLNSSCPKPGHDGKFLADIGPKIIPIPGHVRCDLGLGIQMANTALGLAAHALAVVANVLSQSRRAQRGLIY